MAKEKEITPEEKEKRREVALKNLKGNLPALSFSYLMQEKDQPYGQAGLDLGYNLFKKYLDRSDVKDHAINLAKASESKAREEGMPMYSGQINFAQLIARANNIINTSLMSVKVSDVAEIVGVKYSDKWAEKYVADLGKEDSSKEEKEIFTNLMETYHTAITEKYMTEALKDRTGIAKGSLEQLLA